MKSNKRQVSQLKFCTHTQQGVVTTIDYAVPPATAVKVWSSGQGRFSSLVKGSRHPSVIQFMVKTSYVEA